jgi:hypothetical protein
MLEKVHNGQIFQMEDIREFDLQELAKIMETRP